MNYCFSGCSGCSGWFEICYVLLCIDGCSGWLLVINDVGWVLCEEEC